MQQPTITIEGQGDWHGNDLPGESSDNWPFVAIPCPGVPATPDALYFRDGELVCIWGQLVWFESDGGHMIIQDPHDSHGPCNPESIHQAIVDLRDDMGSAHHTLFGMQNVMDDCQVEQVKEQEMMSGPLCAHMPPEGMSYLRMSISPKWVVLCQTLRNEGTLAV